MVGKNTVKTQVQIDLQMQELKEKIYQKELEILNLGEMISKIDGRILDLNSEAYEILYSVVESQASKFKEQNDGKSLSKEDKDKITIELRDKANEFYYKLFDAFRDNTVTKGMLKENLFQQNEIVEKAKFESFDIEKFESVKFYVIRIGFEELIIKHFVEKYDHCVTEYSALMNELINLQKERKLL
jgi:hypothetical protein